MRVVALCLIIPLVAAHAQTREQAVAGARDLAYARDGRLALSVRGDLWVISPSPEPRWIRITSGSGWDREPAWTPDAKALVFSSNRGGNFDIWQVTVGDSGAVGAPK